jgi:hypothetical protein
VIDVRPDTGRIVVMPDMPDHSGMDADRAEQLPTQGELFPEDALGGTEQSASYRGPTASKIVGITYRQLEYWARTGRLPYVHWGWRIPFLLGGLLALGFAAWYHRSVPESQAWRAAWPRSVKLARMKRPFAGV